MQQEAEQKVEPDLEPSVEDLKKIRRQRWKNGLRRIWAWLIATIVCTGLAAFMSSQLVLNALPDPEGQIGFSERVSTFIYDVHHFGSLYGIFIFVAFLIAFLAGGILRRFVKFGRPIVYMTAGAMAMLIMLVSMKQVFFGVAIVAGARDAFGLGLQMLAGAVGGYVFAYLSQSLNEDTSNLSTD